MCTSFTEKSNTKGLVLNVGWLEKQTCYSLLDYGYLNILFLITILYLELN